MNSDFEYFTDCSCGEPDCECSLRVGPGIGGYIVTLTDGYDKQIEIIVTKQQLEDLFGDIINSTKP